MLRAILQVPFLTDEVYHYYDASNFSARKLIKLAFIWIMMLHTVACYRGVVRRWDNDPPATDLNGFREYMRSLWWSVTALTALGTIPTPSSIPQVRRVPRAARSTSSRQHLQSSHPVCPLPPLQSVQPSHLVSPRAAALLVARAHPLSGQLRLHHR